MIYVRNLAIAYAFMFVGVFFSGIESGSGYENWVYLLIGAGWPISTVVVLLTCLFAGNKQQPQSQEKPKEPPEPVAVVAPKPKPTPKPTASTSLPVLSAPTPIKTTQNKKTNEEEKRKDFIDDLMNI